MKFHYTACDKLGVTTAGDIDAPDQAEATEKLRRKGLFVVEIAAARSGSSAKPRRKRGRITAKQLSQFCRELSVLVTTGTPVVDALSSLERQATNDRWAGVLADVRHRVEEGAPLSDSLAAHPDVFDAVARSLVAAGESSGQLESMLRRLAVLTRRSAQTRAVVAGALMYPILLIGVAMLVLVLMLVFVLPKFEGLFETLNTPLPPTTRVLMVLSHAVREYWWVIAPGMAVTGFGFAAWCRSAHGKRTRDTAAIRLPQMGPITRNFATARITRLLGVLLQSKVGLTEALDLTRQAMTNHHYEHLIAAAEKAVTRGESVSDAFANSDLIAPSVTEAIRNGESSGRLGDVLVDLAEYLDEENETVIRSLATILEPIIMIVLGVIVGFVAISMFLPLFDLTASTGSA